MTAFPTTSRTTSRKTSLRQREWYYVRRYGITLEQLEGLLVEQAYLCPLCEEVIKATQPRCVRELDGVIEGVVHRGCLTKLDEPHKETARNREARARKQPRVRATPPGDVTLDL